MAACGLAQGMDLPGSVAPFILRGVTLAGVDSVNCPAAKRAEAWRRLATDLRIDLLDAMSETITLDEVPERAVQILDGAVRGRLVIDVNR